MRLIDEIINLLGSKDASLTDAFLKTKILIHKIGLDNVKDADWIDSELNGYSESAELPSYRVLENQVLVNAANAAYQFTSYPVPLSHLSKEQIESLTKSKMRHSILELEKFVEKQSGSLVAYIPPESFFLLQKGLDKGVYINQAWCEIGKSDVVKILSLLRNKLLDFVLQLNKVFQYELSEEEFQEEKLKTQEILNNSSFGDNATIVINQGSSNSADVNVNQSKFEELENTLSKNGVSADEIDDLRKAIIDDAGHADLSNRKVGPSVREWMASMFSKAISTAWQIDVGIVSGLLTTAIQKYYGW